MNTRNSYEDSCQLLQELGYIEKGDIPPMPERMPRHDDPDLLGIGFFRACVGPDTLDNLTLPRTLFGRSEVRGVSFVNTDLSESNLCWNDFIDVDFSHAVLSDTDMRTSIFRNVKFTGCDLRKADLRWSTFEGCDISEAMMKGAKLTRTQKPALALSTAQSKEVDWRWLAGDEPGGG